MAKHYLATKPRIGADAVGDTMALHASVDGTEFSLSPAGVTAPAQVLTLKVRSDGSRYIEPPVSDEASASACASILA